jgi:hypothetical protein
MAQYAVHRQFETRQAPRVPKRSCLTASAGRQGRKQAGSGREARSLSPGGRAGTTSPAAALVAPARLCLHARLAADVSRGEAYGALERLPRRIPPPRKRATRDLGRSRTPQTAPAGTDP